MGHPRGTKSSLLDLASSSSSKYVLFCPDSFHLNALNNSLTEKLWLDLDGWLDMYSNDNVGGNALVSFESPLLQLRSTSKRRILTHNSTFAGGLNNGGPAGLVYGFIFTFIGSFLQCLVMAELASMFVEIFLII